MTVELLFLRLPLTSPSSYEFSHQISFQDLTGQRENLRLSRNAAVRRISFLACLCTRALPGGCGVRWPWSSSAGGGDGGGLRGRRRWRSVMDGDKGIDNRARQLSTPEAR
jgi:hypothetical protein